jgi:hypothetical protein
MAAEADRSVLQRSNEPGSVVRAVTVIMGTVVGLTFLFGFGNVLNLALRLGVTPWVAPLVAPAVDLSVLGLLLATRYLALTGAPADTLRPARRLLIFASLVTLALNVAEPLVAGQPGKAAFDAVGPLLLIGWSEVGPGLLQAIDASRSVRLSTVNDADRPERDVSEKADELTRDAESDVVERIVVGRAGRQVVDSRAAEALIAQARREDAAHRAAHQKPISADALRVRLGVGAARARWLVKLIRSEYAEHTATRVARDGDWPAAQGGGAAFA